MKTRVKRDGDVYVMNGSKSFITNGPCGDIYLVYARDDEDGSIQAFIVEREFEGVSSGPPFKKMGMRSSPTSAAKLYLGEVGTRVATEAIHILAGYGYIEEYVVERLMRDAMLLELGGGTTEIQILTIARHILSE